MCLGLFILFIILITILTCFFYTSSSASSDSIDQPLHKLLDTGKAKKSSSRRNLEDALDALLNKNTSSSD